MKNQRIRLDLVPSTSIAPVINVKQYDYGERVLEFEIYDNNQAYNIPDGTTISYQATKPDGYGVSVNCMFAGNVVTCNCTQQMTAVAGVFKAELRFRYPDGAIGSADFMMNVAKSALGDGAVVSDSEISDVRNLVENASRAEVAANNAENSANLAIQAASALSSGSMIVAKTSGEMSNTSSVYLYIGSESGYKKNNWYYYDGKAWVAGGSFGNANSAIVVDNSVSEKKIQDGAVTTNKIGTGAVTTGKLANKSVTREKIADNAINALKLDTASVTTPKIADNAVTNSKILDNAVSTSKIQNGAITKDKLGKDVKQSIDEKEITTDKINDYAVTDIKLAKASVNADKIVDKSIITSKLADKSVTADKLADDVKQTIQDAASTLVVTELPTTGNEKVDYILNTDSGCLYYKWFNNAWHIVAGSLASVVDELPATTAGNEYTDYYVPNASGAYIHYRFKDGAYHIVGSDTYTKAEIDSKISNLNGLVTANATNITANTSSIQTLSSDVSKIKEDIANRSDVYTYRHDITKNDDGNYIFTLYQADSSGEETIASQSALPATGGGGQTSTTTMTITRVTPTPFVLTPTDPCSITLNFTDVDSSGDSVDATYTWKIGTRILTSGNLVQGDNTFDLSSYVEIGTQKVTFTASDEAGSIAIKTWTVQVVDVRLESNYNDNYVNNIGDNVNFTYTPYGAIAKTVHFKLDGIETTENIASSGVQAIHTIEAQPHGSHMLEVWATATINNSEVTTDHIYKDIIWYDPTIGGEAVIGCEFRNDYRGEITARQYDTTAIKYNVYDPNTSYPVVKLYEDDKLIATNTLQQAQNIWNYQSDKIGKHTLKIVCRNTTVTIVMNITELGIDVNPITSGLEIDFNPVGVTNSSADRIWSNDKYKMTVSDNFDWANGGYKTDENGDGYFLIKAGTNVTFDYLMFNGGTTANPSITGAEMKIVFMTENVQDINAVWLTNVQSSTNASTGAVTNMGIQMGAHNGWLKTNTATDISTDKVAATNTYLFMPYSEEDIIEMDINIDPIARDNSSAQAFAMAYEDGVPSKAFVYNNSDRFYQYNPQPLKIGSDQCDVRIYRLKIYDTSLSTENIMKNFIADARTATEKIDRYNRNCIYYNKDTGEYTPYSGEGILDPERLAPKIPDVKVLMLETERFTTSKKDFVKSNLRCIHAPGGKIYSGDPYYDNWYFENGWHSGQGTTSDNYGVSARNVDFLFNCDGVHHPSDKVKEVEKNYISQVTLGYGTENTHTEVCTDWEGDSGKVTLTRSSVPNNYFNFKANVASSENVNNALLQKRYNDFLPYAPNVTTRNKNAKNSMEFVPAVLFIKETSPDLTKHTEFQDTEWHFYALGNIGDSKKTDYTRAYDPKDQNEFTIEISDNTPNNAQFQTGVYLDAQGNRKIETYTKQTDKDGNITYVPDVAGVTQIYPITEAEWEDPTNMRHVTLYEEPFDGDHSFEPRYGCCGDWRDGKMVNDTNHGGKDQIAKNNDIWRAFYRWVITSTDEEFRTQLDEWCARSAMEYFYAFTSIWLMMDNRSKNTFWHFGKSGTWRKMSKPVKELLSVYYEKQSDGTYKLTTDTEIDPSKEYYCQHVFDLWDYDNDSALGINNNGQLIFPYGKEDIDYTIEGNPSSGWAFNGALSTFWCRLRDLCSDEIQSIYSSVDSGSWNAENLINQFDQFQSCYPEEVWRLDIQRKYIRIFNGTSVDNSIAKSSTRYLQEMMQGRKKYQRRQWVRNESIYFGSKELIDTIVGGTNKIDMRCFTPETYVVTPNYDLTITPVQDLYVSVMFGNSINNVRQVRAKANQAVTVVCPLTQMTDTQVIIYAANSISGLNDLSAAYVSTIDFGAATKLKKVVLGNVTKGYDNPKLTTLTIGNNALLEELDIRNCSGLSGSLDFTRSSNLLRLYAEGTKITGVIFATNGKIQLAHLPNTVNTLTMRGLDSLTDFQCNLDSLETLTMEGGTIDSLTTVEDTIDTLKSLTLYNIDWTIGDTTLLNEIYALFSSLLTGKVYVSGAIRNQELTNYKNKWADLSVTYDPDKIVTQYVMTFVNADGTKLYEEYVDRGAIPTDPVQTGAIKTPIRAADDQYTYTYKGWDDMTAATANRTITAQYTETIRTYTVNWYQKAGVKLATTTAKYGEQVVYPNELPTDTSEEAYYTYNIFDGWDKSTGFIKGDTDVYAKWISDTTPATGTDLSTMNPAQIYAVSAQKKADNFYAMKDYFDITLGHDVDFSNVKAEVIAQNKYFDGTTYVDTEYKLFDKNAPSFTLMIDFKMDTDSKSGDSLISAYDENGSEGFRLRYTNTCNIQWGDQSVDIGSAGARDIIVIRHIAGSKTMSLYYFNHSTGTVMTQDVDRKRDTSSELPLTLGAVKSSVDGGHDYFAKGYIYEAKIWTDDLGAQNAKWLAAWPHETLRMEFAGSDRFRLYDGSTSRINASFVANNLLSVMLPMNYSSSNAGGWNSSDMRTFLNGTFRDALDYKWQSIIKKARIPASAGGQSKEIIQSQDYIAIPSIREFNGSTEDPYINEGDAISFFASDNARRKFGTIIMPDNSELYSTGTTDPTSVSSNNVKEGDIWINENGYGYCYISKDSLKSYPTNNSSTYILQTKDAADGGLWIPEDVVWSRSANMENSEYFCCVTNYGNPYGQEYASNSFGVLVEFSI